MKARYHIFGLHRSGTNVTVTLLAKVFGVRAINNERTEADIYKHRFEPDPEWKPTAPVIVVHKSPYMWTESIFTRRDMAFHRTMYEMRRDCSAGIDVMEWLHSSDGTMQPYPDVRVQGRIYETWARGWVIDTKLDVFRIRYEDLLVDESREKILDQIESKYGWTRTGKDTLLPKSGTVQNSPEFTDSMVEYYLNGIPKNYYGTSPFPWRISGINDMSDDVFDVLNYKKIKL